MNPNNPPTETEQELPQLTLEVLVKEQSSDPDEPPTFRLLRYPLKIDEAQLAATGEPFSLRKAVTDSAMQMQASGGIHGPAGGSAMLFYPWHTVQWIKIGMEARKIEREPPPKALVTIGE